MFTFNGYNIEPTGLAYNNRGSMTQDQNTTSEIMQKPYWALIKNSVVWV